MRGIIDLDSNRLLPHLECAFLCLSQEETKTTKLSPDLRTFISSCVEFQLS